MSDQAKSHANRLCSAVEAAREARFDSSQRLCAERIRRLALELPRGRNRAACSLSPFGIRIVGATIRGRLDLDNATPKGGGPLCPLEFHGCVFEGGFSGTHARFSRLSFRDCRFRDAPPGACEGKRATGSAAAKTPQAPAVDLSGATLDAGLSLRGVKPARKEDHLWIRAIGARIAGELDLSRSRLRAPPNDPDQLFSEASPDALDLSLAEIRGDFQFLNGSRCKGRMNFRNCHIAGDIWMSGARLESSATESLFLQSATIGGSVILDGRPEKANESGTFHPLKAVGEINLVETRIGGSLDITDVDLQPSDGEICLRLTGARVGTTVTIGSRRTTKSAISGRLELRGLEAISGVTIKNLHLGAETGDSEGPATINARALVSKHVRISGIEPILCDERSSQEFAPAVRVISADLSGARVESIRIDATRLSGSLVANPLTCAGDAVLDARVDVEVDLRGADIQGKLDISGLRLGRDARGLNLHDASIGRALQFERTSAPEGNLQELVKVRTAQLRCLDATLIETLWRYRAGPEKVLVSQVAFLKMSGLVRPLDGKAETFNAFVAQHRHCIRNAAEAEEYVRLACAYGGAVGDERAWILARVSDAPFLEALPEETDSQAADGPDEPPDAALSQIELRTLRRAPLLDLQKNLFAIKPRKDPDSGPGQFVVSGCVLHGEHFVRASFRIHATHAGAGGVPSITPSFGSPFGPRLANLPVARGLYLYHPPASEPEVQAWVTPPVIERASEETNATRLQAHQALLLPYVQPGASIHGRVDLTDLSCDTLDDGGGASWGRQLRIHTDRFVYRQATWVSDPPDDDFRNWARRLVSRLIAERAPLRLIEKYKWRETRLEPADFWEPWRVRRNWIYQQFELEPDLPSPTRHRIRQHEYRPQPFEQAIRVARSEGREDFAAQFEILKRRIEWSLFSERSRRPLLMFGIAAALLWLILTGGMQVGTLIAIAGTIVVLVIATRPRSPAYPFIGRIIQALLVIAAVALTTALLAWQEGEPWEDARNFAVAVLIMVGLRYISTASDWLMRNLFGYLRLPINAIVSLIVAFLVGWAGVELANDRKMLIIDVEPVANLVARDDQQKRIYVGTSRGTQGAHHVHCAGEIHEPLYALDVLIPLIDLRQENRCEVGRAIPFDEVDDNTKRKPVAYAFELVLGPILDSEGFWAAAKALYAIAGWFLVSLAILTFAVANRAHGEPGG